MTFEMKKKNENENVKRKYSEEAKLCYMDTDSSIVYIKTDDTYKNIVEYVETRFDTSSYELDRMLSKGKNKKVIGLMKDELGGKIMKTFVGLRAKIYSYLIDDGSEDKKAKGTEKCVIKKFCLAATQLKNKINLLEKNKTDIESIKKS